MDVAGDAGLVLTAVALSAASGFRVLIPPLGLAIAAALGFVELPPTLEWLDSPGVIGLLLVASTVEVAGFFIPWLDHLLDSLAAPAAVVSGVLLSAALLGDLDPLMQWALALVAGGGGSGAVQASTTIVRLASSIGTGGWMNILVALAEWVMAVVVTLAALLLPTLLVGVVLFGVLTASVVVLRRGVGRLRRGSRAATPR